MNSFFSQLKQRRVYRVAIGYAIAAWLAVQVAATVLPAFHAPDFVLAALIVLLGVGFPVALVLAWAFDVTPTGIEKTQDEGGPVAAQNQRYAWALAAIGLLIAITSVGAWWFWHFSDSKPKAVSSVATEDRTDELGDADTTHTATEQSIAVLPFDNLSRDPDNAFFASGIQDEILTRLAKIGALKVISRTSTQQYQSKPTSLSTIGKQLGVAHILEGSVQKAGDAVHINVQLIKAATDAQVWAEIYDRRLDDIFKVEGEVATAIAEALNAKVTGNEKQAITARETNNSEAYDAYLRGLALYRKADDDDSRSGAQHFLEQAVRLDPDFAMAWARLARVHSLQFFNGQDATEKRRSDARAALENAVRLQPGLAEVQLAQGYYQYWIERDYNGAATRFEQLLNKWPNNSEALGALGLIVRRQGKWDKSRIYLDRAVALDPLSPDTRLNAANVRVFTHDFPGALGAFDEALNLWPDNLEIAAAKALACQQAGDLDQADEVLRSQPSKNGVITLVIAITNQAEFRRNYPEAIARLQALLQHEGVDESGGFSSSFLNRNLGDLRRWSGDIDGARTNYSAARDELLGLLKSQPNNADLYDSLALVYGGLGDEQDALRCTERAISLMPVTKDALSGTFFESTRAQLYGLFGDREHAIPALERLLKMPGYLSPAILRFAPDFDPIRSDPRFAKLCQEKPH